MAVRQKGARSGKGSRAGKKPVKKIATESLRRPSQVAVEELMPRARDAKSVAPRQADPALSPQIVWYRLLKLESLMGRPFFMRFAQQYEMSGNDWRVMVTLAAMPELASHELCQLTGMHPMNVSRSVASLRKQGRVAERTDPTNRRRKILSLTEDGWNVYDKGVPRVRKMTQLLFSSMSPLEVEFFGRLIDMLVTRLEDADLDDSEFID